MTRNLRFGWQSDIQTFAQSEPGKVRSSLEEFISDASKEQVRAWDQSIPWLQRECRELVAHDSGASTYQAVLEYELPRELRRPDVIVLSRGHVVVLEIKEHSYASQASIDQVMGYARDLAAYHAACAGRTVVPILAIRGVDVRPYQRDGVWVTSPEFLDSMVERFSDPASEVVPVDAFLSDEAYSPLPSIVQARVMRVDL